MKELIFSQLNNKELSESQRFQRLHKLIDQMGGQWYVFIEELLVKLLEEKK